MFTEYLCSVKSERVLGVGEEFLSVQVGRPTVVLLLGISRVTAVLMEKCILKLNNSLCRDLYSYKTSIIRTF